MNKIMPHVFLPFLPVLFAALAAVLILIPAPAQADGLAPVRLRCEFRDNPLGIDSPRPRLEWILQAPADARGVKQTAYRILAASSPALLAKGSGNLWDSGIVASGRMNQIVYAGPPLKSCQQIFWKVQVVDQVGQPSTWSAPARWTMGLLQGADWHGARWIGATEAVAHAESAGLIGYHAAEAQQPDDVKWVQVDLGQAIPIASVRLLPMHHAGADGFGFPLRFKVEACRDADFRQPVTIADQTAADYANPGVKPVDFAAGVTARFVRVTATKLWLRDAAITGTAAYCFALRGINVESGGQAAAIAGVTARDSVENEEWGKAALAQVAASPVARKSASTDSVLLRHGFVVKPRLARALTFVCGLGQYEMTVNGAKVGDDLLTPGWTKYDKTCLYDTYDVTALLHSGENAIGLFLGNGMYNVQPGRYAKFTGSFGPQRAIALVRLEYADGTTESVVTDQHWKAGAGPLTFSSIYGGEDYDGRLVQAGWDSPGFDDSGWDEPVITPGPGGVLKGLSAAGPPIRAFDALTPVSHKSLSPAATVYDLGQNASLMLRLTVKGPAGSSVRITPSELVHDDGDIDDTMCNGNSYWSYTLSGRGDETFVSRFYYRGGRYLKVEAKAAPGSAALPIVTAIAGETIHADAPPVGRFACSNDRFNKIAGLVRWAQMNNMVSIMTDCPTREKLGWLEEDHLNGPALRYNFDMATMMTKMTCDMNDSQRDNGLVPSTCPDYPLWGEGEYTNPPEWGSACIAVPWQQYEFDGDLELLRGHYPMMKRYVDYLTARADDHIVTFGLGDWYDAHGDGPARLTPIGITATAFYFYDAQTLAGVARLLGKADEAAHYSQLASDVRAAYNRNFFHAATRDYATGSQASNAFPLAMGLADTADRPAVLKNLARDMQSKGPTAGEVSLRFVLEALADGGQSELLYTTLNTDTQGYGLQVKLGKTSLTEGWNGGNSQDHFMFGQINEWFYRHLAGIQSDPDGVGFRKIVIRPAIVGDLTWVKASYDSCQGEIVSAWKRSGGQLSLNVTVPPGATATIYVPTRDPALVMEGGESTAKSPGVHFLRHADGAAAYAVGSGHYVFSTSL